MCNDNIPAHIIDAVSSLLKPYGVNFSDMVREVSQKSQSSKYMTARQASVYCGLSAKTIRDKALSGEIGSVRIGKTDQSRVLIVRADLDNWLEGFSSRANHKMA